MIAGRPLHPDDRVRLPFFSAIRAGGAKRIAGDRTAPERNFSNQWGLGAINADQAYAHLELAQGSNAEPGAGRDRRVHR